MHKGLWLLLLVLTVVVGYLTTQVGGKMSTHVAESQSGEFDSNENGAILHAEALLLAGKSKEFDTLRTKWKGRETEASRWFNVDVDALLAAGRRKDAMRMLLSQSFDGSQDGGRLTRLALLSIAEEPQRSWEYLSEALNKDPKNPMLHIYRARMLEGIRKNELALQEYVAALLLEPHTLFFRDQLAEFYVRQKQYPLALQLWIESLNAPASEILWLKAIFWSKVFFPAPVNWQEMTIPNSSLKPLIEYLLELPPGRFWDDKKYEKVTNGQKFLNTQQATFWLRLIQSLKEGKLNDGWNLITYNPFQEHLWNPTLNFAIKRILKWKREGSLQISSFDRLSTEPITIRKSYGYVSAPIFFQQLQELSEIPAELRSLLDSGDAFAAAFLAAGWLESALQLNQDREIPETFPDWYAYSLTQALGLIKGDAVALLFAQRQKATPPLDLLTNELAARLALQHGDEVEAERLYVAIQEQSAEAKSYLARQAFLSGDLQRAKELTRQLQLQYPNNPTVHANLKKITEKLD